MRMLWQLGGIFGGRRNGGPRPHLSVARRTIVPLVLAAGGALAIAACGSSSSGSSGSGPIKVGAVSILSGPSKVVGLDTIRGTEFELNRINHDGGVLGRKLQLVTADGENDPTVAPQAIGRLLRSDHVSALLGPVNSVSALSALGLVAQAKTPMVLYNAGATKLTATGSPWVIHSSTTISAGFEAVIQYAREHNLASKFALIGWNLAPGETGVAGAKAGLAKYGGQLVSVQLLPLTTDDFSSALANARQSGATALLIDAPMPFAGVLAKQVGQSGWKPQLLGWGGFLAEDFGTFTGAASNGMIMTDTGNAGAIRNRPQATPFLEAFQQRYGREPNANELIGADAIGILAAGMKKANSTDGQKVEQAIHGMTYPGIVLTYHWTPQGDIASYPIVVTRWDGGQLQYIETQK